MNVRDEIEQFALDKDKPILLWLLSKYHWNSQWAFVAHSYFQRYGVASYQVNRIWEPTEEGRILYQYFH